MKPEQAHVGTEQIQLRHCNLPCEVRPEKQLNPFRKQTVYLCHKQFHHISPQLNKMNKHILNRKQTVGL